MTGYKIVNLKLLIEELGEDRAKEILSSFRCPLNPDVEDFLRIKAIEFAKQGLSQTHLVMASYREEPVVVGYFTLANKYIAVSAKKISGTTRKRINKFAIHDGQLRAYYMATPLIAQLGKNYANGFDKLISGDELLYLACQKVSAIQWELGGKYVYIECEDKEKLTEFYRRNGFYEFDTRKLDKDESGLDGDYLVQMLKYLH